MVEGTANQLFADHRELRRGSLFTELEFFTPTLVDATPDKVEVPQIESELLPVLRRHRLVILGGRRVAEKLLFAKALAWHLAHQLDLGGTVAGVLQWHPHSSLVHVSDAFDRHSPGTIFLLPGLQPHHLGGYDLRRLLDHLDNSAQYGIFTTDTEIGQWSLPPEWAEQGIWHDAAETLYSPEHLVGTLLTRLEEVKDRLGGGLAERLGQLDSTSHLAGNLGVRELAVQLKTPSRIRSFAIALSLVAEPSEAAVRATLQQVVDDRLAVHAWYRHLPLREQVLALGLALCDGLLDDQVFATLEVLVDHTWRGWDPLLSHFDYHELGRMTTYFEGARELSCTTRIECTSAAARHALFEVGWLLHRRRILATLPALARIVRESPGEVELGGRNAAPAAPADGETKADGESEAASSPARPATATLWADEELRASRWHSQGRWRDLFGSALRNGLLRHCVAGTLSQVAWVAVDAVEPILLDLAQDERRDVQSVAAAALARWREHDADGEGDRRLFSLLAAWQTEAFHKEYAQHRLRRRDAARPYSYVRSTIALTLSRAAIYDPPNQLREPLVRLFEKLVADRSSIVRSRLRLDTIPWLVAGHLRQLETLAWERLMPELDLLVGTAVGMAGAHQLRPTEARPILEAWHRKALALPADEEDERRRRAHALVVTALAYGLIEPGGGPGGFTASEVFDVLGGLLAGEDEPLVRAAVLRAMVQQARSDIGRVASLIQDLVAELGLEERGLVVDQLTEIYLHQREHLTARKGAPAPDSYELVEGVRYPIWSEGERPTTAVEEALRGWLRDPLRPAAIQVALECLTSFAASALERREAELRAEAERLAEGDDGEPETKRPELPRQRRLSLGGHFAAFAVLPWNAYHRSVLVAALPELLRQSAAVRPARQELLREVWNAGALRWSRLMEAKTVAALLAIPVDELPLLKRLRASTDPADQALAKHLSRAAWIYSCRWPLAVAAVLALAVLAI